MATTEPLNRWGYNVLIALDQLCNALLRGAADETLSSRTYRGAMLANAPKRRWKILYLMIEGLFFWETNHCQTAYESELSRKQFPDDFTKGEKMPH